QAKDGIRAYKVTGVQTCALPISPAEQGTLVILASGPEEALERCQPLFDAIGERTMRLGAAGTATRLKLVTNAWVVTVVEGVAERSEERRVGRGWGRWGAGWCGGG